MHRMMVCVVQKSTAVANRELDSTSLASNLQSAVMRKLAPVSVEMLNISVLF